MVLTAFPAHCPTARLTLRGPADRLQSVGEIIQELYPDDVLVSSDEDEPSTDELDDSQLALLEEIADYQRALLHSWAPAWA
jgi:hypothetical protein